MIERYYRKHEDRITGPFPAARLIAMQRGGIVTGDDLLSTDKIDWKPATDFEWLFEPNVIPLDAVSDSKPEAALKLKPLPEEIALPRLEPIPVMVPVRDEPQLVERMSAGRIIGDTLMLTWNSCDKLLPLRRENEPRRAAIAAVTAFLLALTLSGLAGMACARLYQITLLQGLGSGLGVAAAAGILIFVEIWLFEVVLLPDELTRNCLNEVMLAAVTVFILTMGNITTGATLHLMLFPPHPAVRLAAVAFNLLVWSFAVANTATALRIGLEHFSGARPRSTVWMAGLVVGSNLILLFAMIDAFIISKGLS